MVFAALFAKREGDEFSKNLSEIIDPVQCQLERVEERLSGVGESGRGILKEASDYVLKGGGKRVRAALILLSSSVRSGGFSGEVPEQAVDLAVAVELIHSATLVHDDLVDRAALRRLKPTATVRFGEDVALLLGDFLYAKAFGMIAAIGDGEITSRMAETTERMCEGEIEQLKHRWRADLRLDQYVSFVEKKTAALIAASASCGARLGGLSVELREALGAYGLGMGVAFQVIDDWLDVAGSESRVGKTLGTDLDSGKLTLPMIFLIGHLSAQEKENFFREFQSASLSWDSLRLLIDRHSIASEVEAFVSRYRRESFGKLEGFHPSVRKTLEELFRFVLGRTY